MPCCGESYVVNDDFENPSRGRKKDESFKSIVQFMLLVLLIFALIFCLVWFLANGQRKNETSLASQSRTTQTTSSLGQIYTESVVTEDPTPSASLNSVSEESSTIAYSESTDITTRITTTAAETSHSTMIFEDTTLASKLFLADPLQEEQMKKMKASLCGSAPCKSKAGQLLQLMDHSIDLCEDFYEFACGAASEPTDDEWTDILLEAVYVARNNKQIYTFQYLLNNTNSLTSYNSIPFSFTSSPIIVLPHITIQYGFVGEQEGYGLQILPLTTPKFSMEECTDITSDCTHLANNSNHLSTIFEEYDECQNASNVKNMGTYHMMDAGDREDFDSNFIFEKPKVTSIAVLSARYTIYELETIGDLAVKYPVIDWKSLFDQLANNHLNQSTPVYLYVESKYFQNLMSNLKSNEKIQKALISYSNMHFRLNVLKQLNDRRFVVRQVADMMPQTAKNLIGDLLKLPQLDMKILDGLKAKFYWLIEVSRLEEVIKEDIKEKLNVLKFHFHQREDTSKDCLRLNALTRGCLFNIEPHWNQKYPEFNRHNASIYIPLRFLYKYSKFKEQPPYIAEAYLTFHISRAIALYLDSFAKNLQSVFYTQFLKTLNTYMINEENTLSWKGRTITYTLPKDVIDLTTSDRLADILALKIAFSSTFPMNINSTILPWISDDYTAEQQFFIAIAQDYCGSSRSHLIASAQDLYDKGRLPHQLRIKTLMSKSREFEDTFKCPRGSRMNPEDKIEFESFAPIDEYYQAYEEQINK